MHARSLAILLLLACALSSASISATPVAVLYQEGLLHGFLTLKTLDGTLHRGRRCHPGPSWQSDHDPPHIPLQGRFATGRKPPFSLNAATSGSSVITSCRRGRRSSNATEVTIALSTGQVTIQYTDDDGKDKTVSERMKLPPDLANGLVLTLLKNLPPDSHADRG